MLEYSHLHIHTYSSTKKKRKTRSLRVNHILFFKDGIKDSSTKENLKRKSGPFCSSRTKLSRQKQFRWCITSQPRAVIMKRDNIISDTSDSKLALLHRAHCSLTLYSSSFETWYSSFHLLFTLYLICISSLHTQLLHLISAIQYSLLMKQPEMIYSSIPKLHVENIAM